jgi:hypothetical protein
MLVVIISWVQAIVLLMISLMQLIRSILDLMDTVRDRQQTDDPH